MKTEEIKKTSIVIWHQYEQNEITCGECGFQFKQDFTLTQVCCPKCKIITKTKSHMYSLPQ
jgi:hypothetical protein